MNVVRLNELSESSGGAAASGELAALCAEHAVYLQRFLLSRGAKRGDVEDLLQQVFAVYWEKRAKVLPDKAAAFLTGIARNVLLAHKRKSHTRERFEEEHRSAIGDLVHSAPVSAEQGLVQRERRQGLLRLMEQLTPRMAQVVRMLYLEERTRAEVAQLLGITRQTLHSAERRALHRLGELLRDAAGD
jgi:RNA polymerase sigma factor (sigma-70 family)